MSYTKEQIRAVGGIVHSDGNVFFTSIEQLNALASSELPISSGYPNDGSSRCAECDGKGVAREAQGSAWPFPCAACNGTGTHGVNLPDAYQLAMVPKLQPGDEPDWDECIRQAEAATGLKVERHTLSIVIREVRRWLAGRTAGVPPSSNDQQKGGA
jgi:hypothetical protein